MYSKGLQLETVSSFKFLLVGRHYFFMVLYMLFFPYSELLLVFFFFLPSVKQLVFLIPDFNFAYGTTHMN